MTTEDDPFAALRGYQVARQALAMLDDIIAWRNWWYANAIPVARRIRRQQLRQARRRARLSTQVPRGPRRPRRHMRQGTQKRSA